MIVKKKPKQLSTSNKINILLEMMQANFDLARYDDLTAPELRSLRDFLLEQVIHLSPGKKYGDIVKNAVMDKFEPIPKYFHRQVCREPLEACYNETCMASNPLCFSRKMKGQVELLVSELQPVIQTTSRTG